MNFKLTTLLLAGACLCCSLVHAQESKYPRKSYTTAHTGSNAPTLDGKLDESCWDNVDWGGDFVQWDPTEGEPPTQATMFKILYDEDALYFGARAYDSEPDKIAAILARRDWFPGDWVEINIDSYFDKRTAYSFTSSVSGTRGDEYISNDGSNWDGNWDPVWEVATHRDEDGWSLEARIPLSQLRYGDKDEHVWGFQVQRRLHREEERSLFQPFSKDESGWVSRFAELRGIKGISRPKRVELLPYSVTKAQRDEKVPGDPFNDGSSGQFSLGLDGKVGVTSDLTADFTINPDFGQIEADPSEVNLSAFETFFQERRPFFIEGKNILDFQIAPAITGGGFTRDNLFYSRRIGRQPHHFPDLDDDEYVDQPDNSSILGALKLSGKTKNGLSIGILESVTAEEKAEIDLLGSRRDLTVEPLTNYFVGRARQDLNEGNTLIGLMGTAVNRRIDEQHLEFLHDSAYSGGFDFLHRWKNKTWRVGLNTVFSRVEGSEEAILDTQTSSARYFQRPDNGYREVDDTRTSLGGHAGGARFGRTGGQGLRFETGMAWRSPGFEINDIGFMRRADGINQFTWMGYTINEPFSVFRRMGINTNQWVEWDWGGTNLSKAYNFNFNFQTVSNWHVNAGMTRGSESISNTALRGGPSVRSPGDLNGNFGVNSDHRKTISYGFGASFYNDDEDSRSTSWWVDLNVRPSNALRVSVNPWFSRNRPDLQYVETNALGSEDRYLFGRLDQKTLGLTFRLDYTITPNLTLQYYGSPFISSGEYKDFARITSPRADDYDDRFHRFTTSEIAYNGVDDTYEIDEDGDTNVDYVVDDPDFNFRDFNSNLVMRWEFQPGSSLFLVWSQARSDFVSEGGFALSNDMGDLFDTHPRNIFLVKINKWFSM